MICNNEALNQDGKKIVTKKMILIEFEANAKSEIKSIIKGRDSHEVKLIYNQTHLSWSKFYIYV